MALDRLIMLRSRLFDAIGKEIAECGHSKIYEGAFGVHMPTYFDDTAAEVSPAAWAVTLDCYVVGPNRHYRWIGHTLMEAVEKAEAEVGGWLNELLSDAAEGM